MRTTIDLPDDLLRQTKAVAALRGMKMKDLIEQILRAGLTSPSKVDGHKIPATISWSGPFPELTNAKINELLDQEDLERSGLA